MNANRWAMLGQLWPPKDPVGILRLVLIALVVANLVAGYFVWWPLGGSPRELEQQATDLRQKVTQQSASLQRARTNVTKIELGRTEGDQFMNAYFLARRPAYSTMLAELSNAAKEAKITPRDHSFSLEPIDGSDDLSMLSITGNYEGTYKDFLTFIHLLDGSPRLLIIESLGATPQQGSGKLSVNMKLDTFVREDGTLQ
jgi:hypothetical protein